VLAEGEPGAVTGGPNHGRVKIGNGLDNWNSLDFPAGKNTKPATIVIGTAQSGHTANDVDFLCTGTDDHIVINEAIAALPYPTQSNPHGGGKIVILEGVYNLGGSININKPNVTLEGMGPSTVLNAVPGEQDSYNEGIINIMNNNCKASNLNINGNSEIGVTRHIRIGGEHCVVSDNKISVNSNEPAYGDVCNILVEGHYNTIKGNLCEGRDFGSYTDSIGIRVDGNNNIITINRCRNANCNGGSRSIGIDVGGFNNIITDNIAANTNEVDSNNAASIANNGNDNLFGNNISLNPNEGDGV